MTISAGVTSTCGLKADGSVACWGHDEYGQASPPGGEFDSLSAGQFYACGVRVDGSVNCWGHDEYGQASPPGGEFESISAGRDHTCGVTTDGSVACWGNDDYGQASPSGGEFISVSAGNIHTCGVRIDGSVACWGHDEHGQSTAPEGRFAEVSAGDFYSCGVRVDGSVVCWGSGHTDVVPPPGGEFISISNGTGHACGLRADGSVACWGNDGDGQATPPEGEFISVNVGWNHTCGVRVDGSAVCWGDEPNSKAASPEGEFISVIAGRFHTCGVRTDGTVACWGDDRSGQSTAPGGESAAVGVGERHTCGVRVDGSVACWGSDSYGDPVITPPEGEFTSISAGWFHTCVLGVDGAVLCWGADSLGESTPPEGKFTSVSAGRQFTCGVKTDGSVTCWGIDEYGESTPPEGEFTDVSAGVHNTCGLRVDGSVTCWGLDTHGDDRPPGGEFTSISAGNDHACGLRTDGSIACWGDDWGGRATPPQAAASSRSGESGTSATATGSLKGDEAAAADTTPVPTVESFRRAVSAQTKCSSEVPGIRVSHDDAQIPLEQLIDRAAVIVHARGTSREQVKIAESDLGATDGKPACEWVILAEVEVREYLKGEGPGTMRVALPVDEFPGLGRGMVTVGDLYDIEIGSEYVLFLDDNRFTRSWDPSGQTWAVVFESHGRWQVEGERLLTRLEPPEDNMTFEELRTAISPLGPGVLPTVGPLGSAVGGATECSSDLAEIFDSDEERLEFDRTISHVRLSLEELMDSATLIVRVRGGPWEQVSVPGGASPFFEGKPVCEWMVFAELEVQEYMKGNGPDTLLVALKVASGPEPDRPLIRVEHSQNVKEGLEYVLFLRGRSFPDTWGLRGRYWSLLGGWQGRWPVVGEMLRTRLEPPLEEMTIDELRDAISP